jgi:hypothetical protein
VPHAAISFPFRSYFVNFIVCPDADHRNWSSVISSE